MGWRFQKRVRILPGVTLNFSRKGVSTSIGTRGARVTLGHDQRRTTLGLPGSGISHTEVVSTKRGRQKSSSPPSTAADPQRKRLVKLALIAGLIFLAFLVFGAPAWAINKCTGADGKVSFQDAPCQGKGELLDVRPASGKGNAPVVAPAGTDTGAAGVAKPQTEAQRIDAQVTASQRERRKRDLEQLFIPQAKAATEQHRASCAQKQASLDASKYAYKQNLYGKTHAAQVASEMAAAAAACETKDRELKESLEGLRKECDALGCAKT